ncbi:ABC transporter permease subunit [Caldilinea sp.]|uniref:ABC transporter permease subunit n=1 Tax=Caldilinea sp. TaxID=2293560 RepID=UPI002618D477|nr:ABC transporter permease subunit [uncultured Caldilinea sp.]
MKKRLNLTPYWLILPSVIYLALFFAWPMVQALTLSIWDGDARLQLRAEATLRSPVSDWLPRGAPIEVVERRGNTVDPDDLGQSNLRTEVWFYIRGESADGRTVEGWAPEARVRVRETDAAGAPTLGTIRPRIGGSDPLTTVYAEPSVVSDVVGRIESNAVVAIERQTILELWYLVRGERDGAAIEGWAPSRYVQVFGDNVRGRIDRGDAGELTLRYLRSMINDRFFWPALWTTLLLMAIIIPVQFVLAIIMALIIQQQLRGNTFFLYVFAIALGVSELAVGIVWYAIFTQNGYLNSILVSLGWLAAPIPYLTADTRHWIIVAIWLAEIWRATALVMVIVVAGLQAISHEILEAADLFGANLWKRVRYVILPMLKPSLQVALILRTILALQVFAVVIALSGGDVVTVLANEAYRQYYTLRNVNVAAAYAALILLLSMFSAAVYLRMVRSHEEMQE